MSEGGNSAAITRILRITNQRGLHARAAAKLVGLAERYSATVDVVKLTEGQPDSEAVSARSIMGLMMLGAGVGSDIQISAEGWDAKEALEAIAGLVEGKFLEQE